MMRVSIGRNTSASELDGDPDLLDVPTWNLVEKCNLKQQKRGYPL